jgi:stage IV sporulation protein FB
MLVEPAPTPYDLRFRLFGTDVRVHPLFWLVMVIFGWTFMEFGFFELFLWVVCAFVSILLHEFGHIWAGRAFGTDGYIVLYGLGGLAVGANDVNARWKRMIVSLAGPAIQLALFGVVFAVAPVRSLDGLSMRYRVDLDRFSLACYMLWEINLYWALLNLLPIWPLDGGMVCRELCSRLGTSRGVRVSLLISTAVAGLFAVNALVGVKANQGFLPYVPTGGMYMVFFFAIFAIESWMLLSQSPPGRSYEADDRLPWEQEEREREPWER